MKVEDKYREIGKAVIDECIERGGERCITITLRGVQFDGRLSIRMEDMVGPISIWDYDELIAITLANRNQRALERAEALGIKINRVKLPPEPPRVVMAE